MALAVFWLLLSGYFQALLLIFGLVSVVLVVYLIARMDQVDQQSHTLRASPRRLMYFVWLLGQIVRSSVHVAKLVWRSPRELDPALGQIKMSDDCDQGRVLYANSITLTPGTLSVDLKDDVVTVHALRADSLVALKTGEMEQKVAASLSASKRGNS